jgi:glycosyltransferase involved in cell wall biosynthesis
MRTHALLRNLARRHEITMLAFDRKPQEQGRAEGMRQVCAEVVPVPLTPSQTLAGKRRQQLLSLLRPRPYQHVAFHSREMQQTIDRYLREQRFDLVHIDHAQMGYHRFPAEIPCVLDTHNVEYELLQRVYQTERPSLRKLYSFSEWQKFRRDELSIYRRCAAVTTTSERDRATLASQAPGTAFSVVPNGVDCDYFVNPQRESGDNTILFTGTIDYFPNTDGLQFFLEEILPLIRQEVPDVTFCIAGKNPPPSIQRYASDPRITITGFVKDIREVFRPAALVVAPLRIGGGTRLKILEAMAMHRAVVSTAIGAEGLDVADGRNILLADGPVVFARAVVELLRDRARRERIAAAGRRLVEQQYDWKMIAERMDVVYTTAVERAPCGSYAGAALQRH